MSASTEYDPKPFRDFEEAGWNRSAKSYADAFGRTTAPFEVPLLDAAGVTAGTRLLDLACGPGDLAALAASRGAAAVGADLAEEMVAEARRRHPEIEFHCAPAEALPFDDGSFDAVCCSFAMHHFSEPERAAAEAYRVLASNGRFAFTVWGAGKGRSYLFQIVGKAIEAHGSEDVGLPEGPPTFALADPKECRRMLGGVGFAGTKVEEVTSDLAVEKVDQVLEVIYTTVRTRALVEAQPDRLKPAIHEAILEGARRFERDGEVRIPMTGVLTSTRRPAD